MWRGKTVSVSFPTYREKDSIRKCVVEAALSGVIDEILVINNNAEPGTSEEVAAGRDEAIAKGYKGTVREIFENRQGYGAACMRGLNESTAYYSCLCEPDDTFVLDDVWKLLAYSNDYDIVYGSRTNKDFIWSGANMGPFLRWGNWAVAKMLEILYNTNSLTDVGCTMRLLKRESLEQIRPYLTVEGSFFGPQMMLVSVLYPIKCVQIPVNYKDRVGVSAVTGDFWKAWKLGWRMIFLIWEYRIGSWMYGKDFIKKYADKTLAARTT